MMHILREDFVIETFDSPSRPPLWIEWIDVENEEYQFCSVAGQKYRGELVRAAGWFRAEEWRLAPVGPPSIGHALELIDLAEDIEPNRCAFSDIASLRGHALSLHREV